MKKAFSRLIFAMLLSGSNGIVASQIALPSTEITFLRALIGSFLLLGFFFWQKARFTFLQSPKDALFLLFSGVSMGGSWLFLYEAYQQLGVSITILIHYTAPAMFMLLSPIFFKERLTLKKCIGLGIVLLGIFCINGQPAPGGRNLWGLFCAVMSAVLYTSMVIANKKIVHINGMENAVLQMAFSFLTIAVFFVVQGKPLLFEIPMTSLPFVLLLGIVNGGIANYLYFSSIGRLPVQTVAVFSYLDPLTAVVLSALLLGEKMGALQIIGAACILGGAIFAELAGKAKNQEE